MRRLFSHALLFRYFLFSQGMRENPHVQPRLYFQFFCIYQRFFNAARFEQDQKEKVATMSQNYQHQPGHGSLSGFSVLKVGVFVDVAYMYRNGGRGLRYDVLREFAGRDDSELLRLNAYVSFDAERAEDDEEYREGVHKFYSTLRDYGFKVIKKLVKWYEDDAGNRYGKANADLDLGVDALLQSEALDRMLIATGDGDFIQVVRALQNKGCRVETVALDNVSTELRHEVDMFMSGYLIPNLIPTRSSVAWGELGSRVRGTCYWYNREQGFGFMRFLDKIAQGLWLTDTRHPLSPYKTVYFHDSNLAEAISISHLPSREYIFEFELGKSLRQEGWQALDIELASKL